tara:strand:- start:81 stop:410 length:330 start_codon:yes stop_codon:yes gene_type:complete
MSRVFVIQNSMIRRHGEWVPKFNVSSASKFGELVSLTDHGVSMHDMPRITKEFRNDLQDFSPDDYLLTIGSPVLIGIACAIAAEHSDILNFVQWDKMSRMYLAVTVDLR